MKKLFYLVCILMVSISYSQNTFRLWHFNAKDGTEERSEERRVGKECER